MVTIKDNRNSNKRTPQVGEYFTARHTKSYPDCKVFVFVRTFDNIVCLTAPMNTWPLDSHAKFLPSYFTDVEVVDSVTITLN